MFRIFLLLPILCWSVVAAEAVVVRSGPVDIFSLAGDDEAKDLMNFVEQLRYTLGWQLGNADLQPVWRIRILQVKKNQPTQPGCSLARDAFVCSIAEGSPELAARLTKILLDSWVGHLPPPIERGLLQVYSTIRIEGTKITLGETPSGKDRDWSRAHMLSVDPNYSGKLRVMLGNLSKGVEPEVAYRNAFGQGPEEIEMSVNRYIEAGQYGTFNAPSRALNARRQLIAKPATPADIRLLQADLLLAGGKPEALAAFQDMLRAVPDSAEGHEGLGLLALRAGDTEEARKHLAAGKSARALVEYAKLTSDPETKRSALTLAATANASWSEPHRLIARMETHPAQKLAALKKASSLEPRNAELWTELATLQDSAKMFAEAAKSWAAAERATGDPDARNLVRESRLEGDRKRLEADVQAKEEARRKTQAEEDAVRNKALMGIREAEARANAGKPVIDSKTLERYKEGPDTKKAGGTLQRVDCLGQQARLYVTKGKQIVVLLVSDPTKVAISGGGQTSLTCGPQKPARLVSIEYIPRPSAGQGISGDVVTIEFQ